MLSLAAKRGALAQDDLDSSHALASDEPLCSRQPQTPLRGAGGERILACHSVTRHVLGAVAATAALVLAACGLLLPTGGRASSDKAQGVSLQGEGSALPWPVTGVYVINMPNKHEIFERFKSNLQVTTGFPQELVQHHDGVIAADALQEAWPYELLPSVYTDLEAGHAGQIGLCLAHMSAWKRVQDSENCQAPGSEDKYGLIFEDDEVVKGVFPAVLRRIMQLIEQHEGPKPDMINLNCIRPTGDTVPGGENFMSGSYVREVTRGNGYEKCWDPADTTCPNIWMSSYLVRCGGAAKMIQAIQNLEHDGTPYDGSLTFDRAVSDMMMRSPPVSEVVSWVVGPNNSFSVHSETISNRKELNGGQAN